MPWIDSPLCPQTPGEWLMPAVAGAHLCAVGDGPLWYPGNRRLVVRTCGDLRAVLEDRYIRGICRHLAGDYIHVDLSGEIVFPVAVERDEKKAYPDVSWRISAGMAGDDADYRGRLVFHGGRISCTFDHVMAAAPVVAHGTVSTLLDIRLFSGFGGMVFMGTHFIIDGSVGFDDSSELRDGNGRNNCPDSATVAGQVCCFDNCSGLSLVGCRIEAAVRTQNV